MHKPLQAVSPPLLMLLGIKVLDGLVVDQGVHSSAAGLGLCPVHLPPELGAPLQGAAMREMEVCVGRIR